MVLYIINLLSLAKCYIHKCKLNDKTLYFFQFLKDVISNAPLTKDPSKLLIFVNLCLCLCNHPPGCFTLYEHLFSFRTVFNKVGGKRKAAYIATRALKHVKTFELTCKFKCFEPVTQVCGRLYRLLKASGRSNTSNQGRCERSSQLELRSKVESDNLQPRTLRKSSRTNHVPSLFFDQ